MGSLTLPPVAGYLMGPGNSPLSVGPEAVELAADVQCDTSVLPAKVRMTAVWRWREDELLPSGKDALAFRWQTADPDGNPMSASVWRLREATAAGVAITDQSRTDRGREGATGAFGLGYQGPDQAAAAMESLLIALKADDDVIARQAQDAAHTDGLVETVMIPVPVPGTSGESIGGNCPLDHQRR